MSKIHGLAAHCLLLFSLHRPEATFLFPQFIIPVYRFFLHICVPYGVNNMWLKYYAKLVSCGHAMT
jgi:hypothetical protein